MLDRHNVRIVILANWQAFVKIRHAKIILLMVLNLHSLSRPITDVSLRPFAKVLTHQNYPLSTGPSYGERWLCLCKFTASEFWHLHDLPESYVNCQTMLSYYGSNCTVDNLQLLSTIVSHSHYFCVDCFSELKQYWVPGMHYYVQYMYC